MQLRRIQLNILAHLQLLDMVTLAHLQLLDMVTHPWHILKINPYPQGWRLLIRQHRELLLDTVILKIHLPQALRLRIHQLMEHLQLLDMGTHR